VYPPTPPDADALKVTELLMVVEFGVALQETFNPGKPIVEEQLADKVLPFEDVAVTVAVLVPTVLNFSEQVEVVLPPLLQVCGEPEASVPVADHV